MTVLENFTFVSAKRQFIISWIGIFLTFLAGGLISSKLLMVAVADLPDGTLLSLAFPRKPN